ncbi:EAL and HDOD domain-containing protein [Neptuniibacter caesariensis]|uniref:Diguanylate phosphodiesterase (EAL domain) n=1 Tax=Neptuniibacter caesariensis TaxID=207954 RepID=A0A7U8C5Q8_NEPCE|nr:HDOD domain-containing protein [Neptuniibacter caesariensis]EAR61997.1 diguanylate phosphodiesterase (EAL domain) [Oceanospirillum sp. MED92] [Neptuniibacter caesariensis]
MNGPILFARQPIFDTELNTYAYQLLYRDNEGTGPDPEFDGVAATTQVLVNAFSNLCETGQNKFLPAYINFNAEWLFDGLLPSVPLETLILEVERDEDITDSVLEQLTELSDAGYRLSVSADSDARLHPLATIITIDIQKYSAEDLKTYCHQFKALGNKVILADKVETYNEFQLCRTAGCDLFLGYFFARPQLVKGKKLARNELVMLQLIGEVHNPDASPESIESLIQKDPQLVTALLRLVNSAAFKGNRSIASIAEAIVVLGLIELRKWVLILSLTRNEQVPDELIHSLLLKGRMCQILAEGDDEIDPSTAFMSGILSGIDALFSIPQKELMEQLPIEFEIKRAVAGARNALGLLLHDVLAYNRGEWEAVSDEYTQQQLSLAYTEAHSWSNEALKGLS